MDLIHKAIVRYKDKYNITIREVKRRDEGVIIEISQDKTLDAQYFSTNELRDIVTSLFASVHEDFHIGAIAYVPLAHDVVTFSWLKKQLADNAMKIKTLARLLGVKKSVLVDHHSGKTEMSNAERGMYYYYFKNIEVTELKDEVDTD